MKNLKSWLKQALFDSDRVVKLEKEVEELEKEVSKLINENQNLFEEKRFYYLQKVNLLKKNKKLQEELDHTKEQLRIQTEMYKNRLKNDTH
jgi:peptidoglycan hydrolase CwlO-like protein